MRLEKFEIACVPIKKAFLTYILFILLFLSYLYFVIYKSYLLHWINIRQPSYILGFTIGIPFFLVLAYLLTYELLILRREKKSISIIEDKITLNEKELIDFHKLDLILIRKRKKILKTLELCILYRDNKGTREFKQNLQHFRNHAKLVDELQKFCEKNNIKFVNDVDRVNEFYKAKKQRTGIILIAMFFVLLILSSYFVDENTFVHQIFRANPFTGEDIEMIQKITWYEDGQNEFEIVYMSIERELMIISFMHYDGNGNLLGDSFYYDEKGKLWKWKLNDSDDPSKGGEWIPG